MALKDFRKNITQPLKSIFGDFRGISKESREAIDNVGRTKDVDPAERGADKWGYKAEQSRHQLKYEKTEAERTVFNQDFADYQRGHEGVIYGTPDRVRERRQGDFRIDHRGMSDDMDWVSRANGIPHRDNDNRGSRRMNPQDDNRRPYDVDGRLTEKELINSLVAAQQTGAVSGAEMEQFIDNVSAITGEDYVTIKTRNGREYPDVDEKKLAKDLIKFTKEQDYNVTGLEIGDPRTAKELMQQVANIAERDYGVAQPQAQQPKTDQPQATRSTNATEQPQSGQPKIGSNAFEDQNREVIYWNDVIEIQQAKKHGNTAVLDSDQTKQFIADFEKKHGESLFNFNAKGEINRIMGNPIHYGTPKQEYPSGSVAKAEAKTDTVDPKQAELAKKVGDKFGKTLDKMDAGLRAKVEAQSIEQLHAKGYTQVTKENLAQEVGKLLTTNNEKLAQEIADGGDKVILDKNVEILNTLQNMPTKAQALANKAFAERKDMTPEALAEAQKNVDAATTKPKDTKAKDAKQDELKVSFSQIEGADLKTLSEVEAPAATPKSTPQPTKQEAPKQETPQDTRITFTPVPKGMEAVTAAQTPANKDKPTSPQVG